MKSFLPELILTRFAVRFPRPAPRKTEPQAVARALLGESGPGISQALGPFRPELVKTLLRNVGVRASLQLPATPWADRVPRKKVTSRE